MRRHLAFLFAAGVVCAIPRGADACSCIGGTPPCAAVWQYGAVFVAQVLRVEQTQTQRRVHLQLQESFRGPSTIATISTGSGGGDCGYAFQPGETYLIYANSNQATGAYSTGICSRTRPISQATEDLGYLRTAARTPSNFGVLRGTVSRSDPSTEGRYTFAPFAGIRVTVTGSGVRQEATTPHPSSSSAHPPLPTQAGGSR